MSKSSKFLFFLREKNSNNQKWNIYIYSLASYLSIQISFQTFNLKFFKKKNPETFLHHRISIAAVECNLLPNLSVVYPFLSEMAWKLLYISLRLTRDKRLAHSFLMYYYFAYLLFNFLIYYDFTLFQMFLYEMNCS